MTLAGRKPLITPSLEAHLFGGFDVRLHGAPLPALRSRREQWLLALLLLRHDRDTAREWLASTLWPDNEEAQALFYLRKALSNLRQALGDQAARLLSPTPRTLRLDLTDAFVDLIAFDSACKEATASPDPATLLQEAIALYRGPLLPDCPEEWAALERPAREQAYQEALERLAAHLATQGDSSAAVPWLRLLVSADPYRESACCALMQALADSGDTAAVTIVYQELRARLLQDFNTAPAPATEALYRQLKQPRQPVLLASPVASPALPTRRHLPVPLSNLIGRTHEIAEVLDWMEWRRLVSLVGTGGIGKTRLAIAAAEAALPRFEEGVWFVDLAPLSDPVLVPQAVAKALGIAEQRDSALLETLAERLEASTLLLVLDNCEHLPDACAELAYTLLSSCPKLSILATSRQALNVMGEQVYRVPSLLVPSAEILPEEKVASVAEKDLSFLLEYEAIRLFVERAVRVNPAFRLNRRTAPAVVEICRQLDGIPLAIEMAAARLRSLSVGEIQSRLADRFRLLTSGNRGALPRQQTLRAAVDWSYDQLTEEERQVLCRMSVFAGGWTREAAESVCEDLFDPFEVMDTLASLVDRSLIVRREEGEETVRYGMLETLRHYGRERLEECAELAEVRRKHRDHFRRLAEAGRREMEGPEATRWFAAIESEHDNLRQALAFCKEEPGEASEGLRLAAGLQRFWQIRGHLREGREHYSALLALTSPTEVSDVRAAALNGAGILAAIQGDMPQARALFEQSLAIKRAMGDRQGIAQALNNLGNIASDLADYAAARILYEESLSIRRELDDRRGIAASLGSLGHIAYDLAEYASARALHQECLAILEETEDRLGASIALSNLGNVANVQTDYAAARSFYEKSLTISRELGYRRGIANTLNNLGNLAYDLADFASAGTLYEESLAISREMGDRAGIANSLDSLGNVASSIGDLIAASALYEEGMALKRALGDQAGIAVTLENQGILAFRQADYAAAHLLYAESIRINQELGIRERIASLLKLLADLAHRLESSERAVHLWGAASALREQIGLPPPPDRSGKLEGDIATARATLGEATFMAAWRAGHAMTIEQSIAYALAPG